MEVCRRAAAKLTKLTHPSPTPSRPAPSVTFETARAMSKLSISSRGNPTRARRDGDKPVPPSAALLQELVALWRSPGRYRICPTFSPSRRTSQIGQSGLSSAWRTAWRSELARMCFFLTTCPPGFVSLSTRYSFMRPLPPLAEGQGKALIAKGKSRRARKKEGKALTRPGRALRAMDRGGGSRGGLIGTRVGVRRRLSPCRS